MKLYYFLLLRLYQEKYEELAKSTKQKMKYVSEIFQEISCRENPDKLSVEELDHIIDFFDKYLFLTTTPDYICDNEFKFKSYENYNVVSKLNLNNNLVTDDYLSYIKSIYNKHRITLI